MRLSSDVIFGSMASQQTFLPQLNASFQTLADEKSVSTADFSAAIEKILPIFDHLGASHFPYNQ